MASNADKERYILHSLQKIQNLIYTSESVKIINDTKNKDVVIFLGNTRCGKSTVVNYVIGNGLVANRVRGRNYNIVKQDPTTAGPAIGVASTSSTSIPTAWISSNITGVVVDAPGFNDNRGETQDIANAFYIKEIINNARSVKLVFISDINDIIHDNIEQFIKFLDIIYRMLPQSGHLGKGMVLLFTKDKEDLTNNDMRNLLRDKILNEGNIKLHNRDLVEYFFHNNNQIVNIRMPKQTGKIINGEVFQNVVETINKTQSFSTSEQSPVVPGISDKSKVFLLEAHRYLSELREFDEVLAKTFGEFSRSLPTVTSRDQADLDKLKTNLSKTNEQIEATRKSNKSKFEKLDDLRLLVPGVQELKASSDLFIKLKFVSFVDEVLKIKESNIFDIKINRLLFNMLNKVRQIQAELLFELKEINNTELYAKLEDISNENKRVADEQQNQIKNIMEENQRAMDEMKKNDLMDLILDGLFFAAKVYFGVPA